MILNNLTKKFIEKPERMRMGTQKLASRYKVPIEEVIYSRRKAKEILNKNLQEWIENDVELVNRDNIARRDSKINSEIVEEIRSLAKAYNDNIDEACKVKVKMGSFHTSALSAECTGDKSIFDVKELISPLPFIGGDIKNVLVIGDVHEPFCKEGYLEFCREMQEKYNCGTVIHIGDAVDNHAISYHESDPTGMSAGTEFNLAKRRMKRWYHTFPEVRICIGNHDALPFRKLFTAGLPKEWLKSYEELLEAPKSWKWDFVHQHEGVIYQHGTGLSGEMASINAARENRQSTVIGHLHTVCNTRFLASYKDIIFGASVGCGIDHKSYAFAYGKEQTRKPVLACTVILNGTTPINLPMSLTY